MVDATALTPKSGAGLPASGGAAPPLLRPASFNLIGGTLPSQPSFTPSDYFVSRTTYHLRRQAGLASMGGGHIAVLGDSNTESFPMGLISAFAEDWGVGGDTLPGLIYRLRSSSCSSLAIARAIVLGLSYPLNDIAAGAADATIQSQYASIMSYLTGPLVIVPPLPTTAPFASYNTKIDTFRAWQSATYAARSQCVIVDISGLNGTIDGLHYTGAVQAALGARIAAALRTL